MYISTSTEKSAQFVHIRRDTPSAQKIVTHCASPCSVQESAQEIMVVHKLETLGNYPVSFCVLYFVQVKALFT